MPVRASGFNRNQQKAITMLLAVLGVFFVYSYISTKTSPQYYRVEVQDEDKNDYAGRHYY